MERIREMKAQEQDMLKNILRTAEQTNEIAKDTNVELHGQSERLRDIDGKLNKINNTLDKSENTAKEMDSYWTYFKNKVKRVIGIQQKPAFPDGPSHTPTPEGKVSRQIETKPAQKTADLGSCSYEGEGDDMLDEIIGVVKQTRGHCKLMSEELDQQHYQLGKIEDKTDRANTKTQKVNKILGRIINK